MVKRHQMIEWILVHIPLLSIMQVVIFAGFPATVQTTTGNITATSPTDNDVSGEIKTLWLSVAPILLVVGVVGNCLILVTMTRQQMSGTSTCVYLVAMAVLDTVVLVVGLIPDWLEGSSIVVLKNLHPAACKLLKFLSFVFGDLAIWIRVIFTLDRVVAVRHPLYFGGCCGRVFSAVVYVIVTTLASVAKNLHLFWTRGAQYKTTTIANVSRSILISNCGEPTPNFAHFESYVRPWIAFVLISAVPFIIMSIANAVIVIELVRRRRRFKSMMSAHVASAILMMASRKTFLNDHVMQITAMSLAASGSFLLCTAPSIILLAGKVTWNQPPGQNSSYEITKAVNNLLYYVVFAINFFLYCLTAEKFRLTLRSACMSCHGARSSVTLLRHGAVRQHRHSVTTSCSTSISMTSANGLSNEVQRCSQYDIDIISNGHHMPVANGNYSVAGSFDSAVV